MTFNSNDAPYLEEEKSKFTSRPINTIAAQKDPDQNKLVAYIDQQYARDKGQTAGHKVNAFVARNDMLLVMDTKEKSENDPDRKKQPKYKHFLERNIQAVLNLDTWMYTLSNPCSTSHKNKKRGEA